MGGIGGVKGGDGFAEVGNPFHVIRGAPLGGKGRLVKGVVGANKEGKLMLRGDVGWHGIGGDGGGGKEEKGLGEEHGVSRSDSRGSLREERSASCEVCAAIMQAPEEGVTRTARV